MVNETPQVMTIAGTDSSGGAGMTADLNTFAAHGIYGANVVVSVTAQNTLGVQHVHMLPQDMVMAQLQSVADDLAIRAVKTGMLGDAATVETVAQGLQQFDFGPLILDPVMVAKGGAQLLSDEAVATVRTTLMPLATLITPNIPEAEVLTGLTIQSPSDIMAAADRLHSFGTKNILIKGGHGNAREVTDYVRLENGEHFWLQTTRFDTPRTHGTGDTISAAITAQLGLGVALKTAIIHAKAYVDATIRDGIAVGHGHGPLNHFPKVTAENQPEVYDAI
ncbi:bifunctional hydroxymethylpyrimidine kinase/phosphomethylpyrimidine kinase [Leuconostoc lactis]|uniref:bifunctional hydroxymethylpyrimidine kinase/phosphomethylpyrimidine kinase n=1 Tax=Leuconostoc lactis TaxID=1246 RepID=UPI00272C2EBA|nr:bifunctional hydroxymethylpyrimidine kinase/phosphomethylpyrimidine kinase [Leuconostoc lactis]WKY79487.1 bifunctional hydroxymethylpyrimidine kinase/phosphomethylpyrimidine kinase [Leuconostoc lactis]